MILSTCLTIFAMLWLLYVRANCTLPVSPYPLCCDYCTWEPTVHYAHITYLQIFKENVEFEKCQIYFQYNVVNNKQGLESFILKGHIVIILGLHIFQSTARLWHHRTDVNIDNI